MKTIFRFLVCLTLLNGCAMYETVPTENKHIKTEKASFFLAEGKGMIQYANSYRIKTPFPVDTYASVVFENPEKGKPNFVSNYVLPANATSLKVKSETFGAISNGGTYKVWLHLFREKEHKNLLTTTEDTVRFYIPHNVFEKKGIRQL